MPRSAARVSLLLAVALLAGGVTLSLDAASSPNASVAGGAPAVAGGAAGAGAPSAATASKGQADSYAKLPLSFVPNRGQADSRVRYQAQAGGASFFFTDRGPRIAFAGGKGDEGVSTLTALELGGDPPGVFEAGRPGLALDLRFVGANPDAGIAAEHRAPGTVNYLIGNDPSRWQRNLPTFSQLSYTALWPGIDMAFRGQNGRLKYEFAVAPGADPSQIGLAYAGAQSLAIGPGGGLLIDTQRGTLRDSAPVSYQLVDGRRVPVESSYKLQGKNGYGFELGAYDRSLPLIIDPGLDYSTFLGGSGAEEGYSITVDASGSAYVTGITTSNDFPTTSGSWDETYNTRNDAFVTKLNPAGTGLVYSTYLGGQGNPAQGSFVGTEQGNEIAVDTSGYAYVTGSTRSADFPTTLGAFDRTYTGNGGDDVFVAKLNPSGSALEYSTLLGQGQGNGIAIDSAGNAYVTGSTFATNFPTTPGAADTSPNGSGEGFVSKLDPAGATLVYSTYFGGSDLEVTLDLALDPSGSAYVTGTTYSDDFPTTPGAHDTSPDVGCCGQVGFVTKLDPAGATFAYSTYLGGQGLGSGSSPRHIPHALTVDALGHAYVTGMAGSPDFPTTPGAYDRTWAVFLPGADGDAFLTKLNPLGSDLVYSTFLGGNRAERGFGVAVDPGGNAYVTGTTTSEDFPTTPGAHDRTINYPSFDYSEDAYILKMNAAGSSLLYSTFLGGVTSDRAWDIAIDGERKAYVTGYTYSSNFPTTPSAWDTAYGTGNADAFVTKLDPSPPECSDGGDNDSDGGTDYPADQGCDSAEDDSESPDPPECSDRLDNDGDGYTNYPADPGCDSADDDSESPNPQCSDGADNDSDGFTDFGSDPGCTSLRDDSESTDANPECSDEIDNDSDGFVDFPSDPHCSSALDDREAGDPECSDGVDNDGDGETDFPDDLGCDDADDNQEEAAFASVSDVTVTEGDSGSLDAVFTITLSEAARPGATVRFETYNGSASAGSDYTTRSVLVEFEEGATSAEVRVPVLGDTLDELREYFGVYLWDPSNLQIAAGSAYGYIDDNDPPAVVITEARFSGPGGSKDEFVEISNRSLQPVDITYYYLFACNASTPFGDGFVHYVDQTTILAPGQSYLFANEGYTGPRDQSMAYAGAEVDIPQNGGVQLRYPDYLTVSDRVGAEGSTITTVNPYGPQGCDEGAGISPPAGNSEHSFVRRSQPTAWIDSDNNASDFEQVSPLTPQPAGSILGQVGPENHADVHRLLSGFTAGLFHPSKGNDEARPGETSRGKFGTLRVRRKFTNRTGHPITDLRIRIYRLTTRGARTSTQADLRLLSSPGDAANVPGTTQRAVATTVEGTCPTETPKCRGLNSRVQVALPGGSLANNASVDFALDFAVEAKGGYLVAFYPEANP